MDLSDHLILLATLCALIMLITGNIDKILKKNKKEKIYLSFKTNEMSFITNHAFIFDIVQRFFGTVTIQFYFFHCNFVFLFPKFTRFIFIHSTFILLIALTIFLNFDQAFFRYAEEHELKPFVYYKFTFFLQWVSIYFCVITVSFSFDYLSASKTLTIMKWTPGKSKWTWFALVLLDIGITIILAFISLRVLSSFGGSVISAYDIFVGEYTNLTFEIFLCLGSWIASVDGWIVVPSDDSQIFKKQYMLDFLLRFTLYNNSQLTIALATALVNGMIVFVHVGSRMWFLLQNIRLFRDIAVRTLAIKTLPFTTAGTLLCVILVSLYLITLMIISVSGV